jgi:hypothetical protein
MTDDAQLRAELERLGRERADHRERARELSSELEPLVRRAHNDGRGIPIAELARITGLARPTVQAMVRGDRRW